MKREKKSNRHLAPRKVPGECLCCGEARPWVMSKLPFTTRFRGVEHTVFANVNQCRHCDAVSTTPEQFEAISGMVRDAHKAWVARKLKDALKELGLSIDGLVEKTEMARATVARASCGQSLIEANTEKLLWLEIDELRRKRIVRIWTTMGTEGVAHLDGSIRISIPKNHPPTAVCYAPILKTVTRSPLASPWHEQPRGEEPGGLAFACA